MDVSIYAANIRARANYVHWSHTYCNIGTQWQEHENGDISSLQILMGDSKKKYSEPFTLDSLGLSQPEAEPNEILRSFYQEFVNLFTNTQKTQYIASSLSKKLENSKNIILRGAPGTGKSYLAKKIAAEMIGVEQDELKNSPQFGFVQFHPSYDYTDFVEGLRPSIDDSGNMGFVLQDGIFKQFVNRARRNYENSKKSPETLSKEESAEQRVYTYLNQLEFPSLEHNLKQGNSFQIDWVDDSTIHISVPSNEKSNEIELQITKLVQMLLSNQDFSKVQDVVDFFKHGVRRQEDSNYLAVFNEIKEQVPEEVSYAVKEEPEKKFVFVIDEMNRGEISKILGELFFSIDPGYRGEKGSVSTQYANLQDENTLFYIPENVHIIGTMNDIDRSVDTLDFAMRRRFRFIEITAEESIFMWNGNFEENQIEEATRRLFSLNKQISATEELNAHYHIGPSYFLMLPQLEYDYDVLWKEYLCPLLEEYIRGSYNEQEKLQKLKEAYEGNDPLEYQSVDLGEEDGN